MSIILCGCWVTGVALPIMVHSTYCIVTGKDISFWYFPFEMDIQIDETTVFGWYMRTFNYLVGGGVCVLTSLTVIPFFVGGCLYIKACCKHFQLIFNECGEMVSQKCENEATPTEKVSEKIYFAISLHIKIIE